MSGSASAPLVLHAGYRQYEDMVYGRLGVTY
jgi:hypothetical protein